MFYVVRVATKQEKIVTMMIEKRVIANKLPIYSVFFHEPVRGYVFIETDDENAAYEAISGIKHVKGMLQKPMQDEQVIAMFKIEEKPEQEIKIGDTVEIVSGPFKGEKARVISVDKAKDEYTVLPLEAVVSIPVRLKGKSIKIVK
ncbi:MAG: transcription elongation factor Spt5 [Candidatus Anstonellales archaeon]